MKILKDILTAVLVASMAAPGALASSQSLLLSPSETQSLVDRTANQYREYKTVGGWLESRQKFMKKEDVVFLRGKIASSAGHPLVEITQAGQEIHVKNDSYPVVLKFDFSGNKFVINNTPISIEGLTFEQLWKKVEDTLPRTHASYSLISEARAEPLEIAFWVIIGVLAVVGTGFGVYYEVVAGKGATACENALNDPAFRAGPKNPAEAEKLRGLMEKVNSFNSEQHLASFDLDIYGTGDRVRFRNCLNRLRNRYNELFPASAPRTSSGAAGAAQ